MNEKEQKTETQNCSDAARDESQAQIVSRANITGVDIYPISFVVYHNWGYRIVQTYKFAAGSPKAKRLATLFLYTFLI